MIPAPLRVALYAVVALVLTVVFTGRVPDVPPAGKRVSAIKKVRLWRTNGSRNSSNL